MDASVALEWIGSFVERHREHLATPGVAIALTDRGGCLGVITDGLANVDAGSPVEARHRFQIGSISKGFTALALLQEVERGRIALDAPVTGYLPWFAVRSAFGPITVHHLLSHTSGLVAGTDFTGDAASEVWSLRETETGFAPGERFLYSNAAYKALGLVLEAVTGAPWWVAVRDRVMEPIGMGACDVVITHASRERLATGHTSPFDDRPWLPRHGWAASTWFESATADGTICATAEELTAYARLVLARGAGVVSDRSFDAMTMPYSTDPDTGDRYGYGLKWSDAGDGGTLLGHTGGMIGFTATLATDPREGVGVVVLMNSIFGRRTELVRFAAATLAAAVRGESPPEIPAPPDPRHIRDAPAYAGRFDGPAGAAAVTVTGDGLEVEADGASGLLVATDEEGVFLVDAPALERSAIRFVREGGVVVGALWGARWLPREGAVVAPDPEPPATWARYPGRYASWNPWAPGFRILLRRGELWLSFTGDATDADGERRLTPLEDGSFRVGETWSPDRVRFDAVIDGAAHRAVFDAAPYYRTFSP